MRIVLMVLILFLSGCAVTGEQYIVNDKGELVLVQKLKLDRPGKLSAETPKGFRMELDTREKNWWERNIVPIAQGTAERTQAVVTN